MRLQFYGCEEPSGALQPLPSLWASLLALLAAAALGRGVEVVGLDTSNPCIRSAMSFLNALGYNIEAISSNRVTVMHLQEPAKPVTTRLNLACGLVAVIPATLFFALYSAPGSRLILDARGSEYIRSLDLRELREVVALMGARVWSGSSTSRFLVLEKKAAYPPRLIRITARSGAIIAALLVAIIGLGTSYKLRLTFQDIHSTTRIDEAKRVLESLGYRVYLGDTVSVEEAGRGHREVHVAPGVAETLSLLYWLRLCNPSSIALSIDGLSDEQIGEIKYILQMTGYDVLEEGKRLLLKPSPLKRIIYSVERAPELVLPLASHAILVGNSAVSGLSPAFSEGLVADLLERIGAELGAELYLEDRERLRTLSPPNRPPRSSYSCSGLDPASCFLILSSSIASKKQITVLNADKVMGFLPYGIENLQRLGVDMVWQKSM